MQPVIYLALADDWEVRGNGTGDPRVLQFKPMRQLVKIFNRYGVRGSFNVEVMQQLTYRRLQDRFPELKIIADEWEQAVKGAFCQGHDIQLHLHPQWLNAEYQGNGNWKLPGDWSIINYPTQQIRAMLVAGKQYLEHLLHEIDPSYTCISFRAGSWCAAPSDSLLPILSELGFVFDMSIVAGLRLETRHVKLDYTQCDERFAPYYPEMRDARRASRSVEPIVCIPTNSFSGARIALFRRDFGKASAMLRRKFREGQQIGTGTALSCGRGGDEWTNKGESGVLGLAKRVLKRYVVGQTHVADLSRLNFAMMRLMMANIHRQAAQCSLACVPVILGSHTKDISDFSDIERFVATLTRSADIKTVTLTEIAHGLRNGTLKVRAAA